MTANLGQRNCILVHYVRNLFPTVEYTCSGVHYNPCVCLCLLKARDLSTWLCNASTQVVSWPHAHMRIASRDRWQQKQAEKDLFAHDSGVKGPFLVNTHMRNTRSTGNKSISKKCKSLVAQFKIRVCLPDLQRHERRIYSPCCNPVKLAAAKLLLPACLIAALHYVV